MMTRTPSQMTAAGTKSENLLQAIKETWAEVCTKGKAKVPILDQLRILSN